MDNTWLKVENIVAKGEIACFEQFLLLSLCHLLQRLQKASIWGKGLSKNNFLAHCYCDLSAQDYCALDFWRTDLKINRGLLLGMVNLHTKYGVLRPKRSSVIERKPFFTSHGHHDLWPSDIKINRGQLLVMTNLHTNYEAPTPKQSSVIEQKQMWQMEGRNGQKQYVTPHVWGRHNNLAAFYTIN